MSASGEVLTPSTGLGLLRRSLRRQRHRLLPGFAFFAVWHLCETSVPIVIGVVIDRGITDGDLGQFLPWLLLVVAVMTVLATAYRFGARFVSAAYETEAHDLRLEIAAHVLHPRGARTDRMSGEVLSLATSDTAVVASVFRQLSFAVASSISLSAAAVYLLVVDHVVGLVVLIGVPTVVLLVQTIGPMVARRTREQQELTASATGLATDLVRGLRPLKGIGGEDVAVDRYRRVSGDAARATQRVARSRGYLVGLAGGLSGLLLALVVGLAGVRALDGHLSIGELIAVVGLTQFMAEPITFLGDLSADFARSRASAQRIADFLRTPRLVAAGELVPTDHRLVVQTAAAGTLRSFDLDARDGELVAVVVDHPAASDDLIRLLAGESLATAGRVELGGADLAELDVEARRSTLIVAHHHATVAEGTIASMIDPSGSLDADGWDQVLAASGAHDVVDLHPDGLERVVRAEGTSLSGGQRQRLVLARALAADPPALVLQDPTSAVDAVTEQHIAVGVATLRRRPGRTTVVITSSPALLRAADHVVQVREGRVARHGRHDDLLEHPDYRDEVIR